MSELMAAAAGLDTVYPVGSIYMSVVDTNPADLFGGTWKQIQERFLLGCGDTHEAGTVGGEFEHTLVLNELPTRVLADYGKKNEWGCSFVSSTTYTAQIIYNGSGGHGGEPHNVTPPIWRSTSGSGRRNSCRKGVA